MAIGFRGDDRRAEITGSIGAVVEPIASTETASAIRGLFVGNEAVALAVGLLELGSQVGDRAKIHNQGRICTLVAQMDTADHLGIGHALVLQFGGGGDR